jgi:hypothetical protein
VTSEDDPADATRVSNWTLATETKPGLRAVYSARRVGQVQAGRNIDSRGTRNRLVCRANAWSLARARWGPILSR